MPLKVTLLLMPSTTRLLTILTKLDQCGQFQILGSEDKEPVEAFDRPMKLKHLTASFIK